MPAAAALRIPARYRSSLRFEIGDVVVLDRDGRAGRIIGIRYGELAYDIRLQDGFLHNVPPEQIRPLREDGRAA